MLCEKNRVEILQETVSPDHVHMLVSIPPVLSVSELMQQFKERTSSLLFHEFKALRKYYVGQIMWADGYLCCSTGTVTEEDIQNYVESQDAEDDVFR